MNMKKIESEIKELNAIRAKHQRNFKVIERKHRDREMSDKNFEKHKQKHDSKIGKIKVKLRELEEKFGEIKGK
jgi:ParB-like chromosome segregation protein Spo0J